MFITFYPFMDQSPLMKFINWVEHYNNKTPLIVTGNISKLDIIYTHIATWLHYFSAVFWTLVSADNTGELLLCVVRWTLQAIARGLHMVEQCSIGIPVAPRNRLLAFINTFKGRRVVVTVFCHEVSLVLLSP